MTGRLKVRVVTNGARRFRRLLEDGQIKPQSLSRVAVSLDTLDETVSDKSVAAARGETN